MAGYLKGRNKTKSAVYTKGEDNHKHDWKQVGKESQCTICKKNSNHADVNVDEHPLSRNDELASHRTLR